MQHCKRFVARIYRWHMLALWIMNHAHILYTVITGLLYISTRTYTFFRTFLTQRTDIFWTRDPKSSADYRHLPCNLFCLRRHVWQEPPSFPPVPGMPPFAPGMPPFMDPSFAMMGMPPPWAMGNSICTKVSVLY